MTYNTDLSEDMKTLSLGIVGSVARAIEDRGVNKPIDVIELHIFASFVISFFYGLIKGLDKAIPEIDGFRKVMLDHITDEYPRKRHGADERMITMFQEYFKKTWADRNVEYAMLLTREIGKPGTIYSGTLGALMNHIFQEPLSEEDKTSLTVPLAIKMTEFIAGCIQSFR